MRFEHNLCDEKTANDVCNRLKECIDRLDSIDRLLEDRGNWDKISEYTRHSYEDSMDSTVYKDYDFFIEGDVTGVPEKIILKENEQGYNIELWYSNQRTARNGTKIFEFGKDLSPVKRVEIFDDPKVKLRNFKANVEMEIKGNKINSVKGYDKEMLRKNEDFVEGFKENRVGNEWLIKNGFLVLKDFYFDMDIEALKVYKPRYSIEDITFLMKEKPVEWQDIDHKRSVSFSAEEGRFSSYLLEKRVEMGLCTEDETKRIMRQVQSKYLGKDGVVEGSWKDYLAVMAIPWLAIKRLSRSIPFRKKKREFVTVGGLEGGKAGGFNVTLPDDTFNSIGGQDVAVQQAYEAVNLIKNRKGLIKLGRKSFRNFIILAGPPGNGKTLLARIIANSAQRHFIYTTGSSFIEKYIGVGSTRVREAFRVARELNAILFIDEFDSIASPRNSMGSDGGESKRTTNQLLAELQGIKGRDVDVIVAFNVNPDPSNIDEAVLNRATKIIHIPNPDYNGRMEILDIHAANKRFCYSIDLYRYARLITQSSGRSIENMLEEAVEIANRHGKRCIDQTSVQEAFENCVLGIDGRSASSKSPAVAEVHAWHEAGHALAGYYAFDGHCDANDLELENIIAVTIVSRGEAGGYTLQRAFDPDIDILRREDYCKLVGVILAGSLAEVIKYGKVTIGGGHDKMKIEELVRNLLTKGGLGSDQKRSTYYIFKEDTDEYRTERDRYFVEGYEFANSILTEHKDKLEFLANALLNEKTIYRERFLELMERN